MPSHKKTYKFYSTPFLNASSRRICIKLVLKWIFRVWRAFIIQRSLHHISSRTSVINFFFNQILYYLARNETHRIPRIYSASSAAIANFWIISLHTYQTFIPPKLYFVQIDSTCVPRIPYIPSSSFHHNIFGMVTYKLNECFPSLQLLFPIL